MQDEVVVGIRHSCLRTDDCEAFLNVQFERDITSDLHNAESPRLGSDSFAFFFAQDHFETEYHTPSSPQSR